VARLLGVHPQTLAGWALKFGWRKKDLDIERAAGITRRTLTPPVGGERSATRLTRV